MVKAVVFSMKIAIVAANDDTSLLQASAGVRSLQMNELAHGEDCLSGNCAEHTLGHKCAAELTDFGDKGCHYKCESDYVVPMTAPSHKGLALDDTTLHWCPHNVPFHWPNTDEPVTSFRMFKAWAGWWNEPWVDKKKAWKELAEHLEATNGQVLVGTQISCSEEQDDEDWENVKEMMKIFGAKRVMGLAIGNELELLWTKGSILGDALPECLDRVWNQQYFLKKFHSRVQEMDALGKEFSQIKVTSVFGGFVLAEPGLPFYELCNVTDRCALVGTFTKNVTEVFGDRYSHTINIYPYFEDPFIQYDNQNEEPPKCNNALAFCKCFETDDPAKCNFPWMVGRVRERLEMLGNVNATLWVGETGWSAPKAETMSTKMAFCEDWSTRESFADFYTNFLDWDLQMNGKYRGPDHVFYFTMRDSQNFGKVENFGLIGDGDPMAWCTNTTCKVQQSSWTIPKKIGSVTDAPTKAPVTLAPTKAPVTLAPTKAPVTLAPTNAPVTVAPTGVPASTSPTTATTTSSDYWANRFS